MLYENTIECYKVRDLNYIMESKFPIELKVKGHNSYWSIIFNFHKYIPMDVDNVSKSGIYYLAKSSLKENYKNCGQIKYCS
jgi:hypothetical protein